MRIAFFDCTNKTEQNLIKVWRTYCVKKELRQYDDIQWEDCLIDSPPDYPLYDYFFLQTGRSCPLTHDQREKIDRISLELCEAGKELHIIPDCDDFACRYIQDVLAQEYDARIIADRWLEQIEPIDNADAVVLVDCDRTLSTGADSTYLAFDHNNTDASVFSDIYSDGFFSCYQAAKASDFICRTGLFTAECMSHIEHSVTLNSPLIDDLKSRRNVRILPITAGNAQLWERILRQAGLAVNVPDTGMIMSASVKFQVCQKLQNLGHYVIAIGDSPLDIPMLIKSNRGYVISNKGRRDYMERVLRTYPHIHCLSYCGCQYPDVQNDAEIESITVLEHTAQADNAAIINKTRSSEGLFGRDLREVHRKIGILLAEKIKKDYPQTDFYVVAILRSGLCLALGIAEYFDCPVIFCTTPDKTYLRHLSETAENLSGRTPILVDGVVNTGKTLTDVCSLFRDRKPVLATAVLSCGAKNTCWGRLYTGRLSPKHYADNISRKNQTDTSDRLFLTFSNHEPKADK